MSTTDVIAQINPEGGTSRTLRGQVESTISNAVQHWLELVESNLDEMTEVFESYVFPLVGSLNSALVTTEIDTTYGQFLKVVDEETAIEKQTRIESGDIWNHALLATAFGILTDEDGQTTLHLTGSGSTISLQTLTDLYTYSGHLSRVGCILAFQNWDFSSGEIASFTAPADYTVLEIPAVSDRISIVTPLSSEDNAVALEQHLTERLQRSRESLEETTVSTETQQGVFSKLQSLLQGISGVQLTLEAIKESDLIGIPIESDSLTQALQILNRVKFEVTQISLDPVDQYYRVLSERISGEGASQVLILMEVLRLANRVAHLHLQTTLNNLDKSVRGQFTQLDRVFSLSPSTKSKLFSS